MYRWSACSGLIVTQNYSHALTPSAHPLCLARSVSLFFLVLSLSLSLALSLCGSVILKLSRVVLLLLLLLFLPMICAECKVMECPSR